MKKVEEATGKKAFLVGKPSPVMMRAARKYLRLEARTVIIGDTMDTDILGGIQLGYTTILTLRGVSQKANLLDYAFKPDSIVASVSDINLEEVPALH